MSLFFVLRRTLDIYAYCHINNSIPSRANTSIIFIDDKNWPMIEQTIENLLSLKMHNIQFESISDVRIVDSIPQSTGVSMSSWCNTNGCLRVLGKIIFSNDCPLVCQLRKINQIETSTNVIEPPIIMNINSTLNTKYLIELDAFTITLVSGDQVKMFLLYNLMENHARDLFSSSILVDNSSLSNITHLVANSMIQSHMNISEFIVIQAEVIGNSIMLNVTVLFTFPIQCSMDCQQIQINKLKNSSSIILNPIVIIYNGKIHFHNVSLIDVFLVTSTENIMNGTSTETMPVSTLGDITKLTFEVNYKLELLDLISRDGPITDNSTLNDLTEMMQTTLRNNSNINVIVFNATIEIDDHKNSTTNYILHLVVQYIYVITCNECIRISNEAVYNKPQINKIIRIENVTLINISRPISVMNIPSITTAHSSTHTVTHSTMQLSTTDSDNNVTGNTSQGTSFRTTDHPISSVHPSATSQHTSTQYHSTEHTTHYASTYHQTSGHTTSHV